MTGGAIVVPVEARFKPSIRVGHFFQAERLSFHLARTKACRSNVLVSPTCRMIMIRTTMVLMGMTLTMLLVVKMKWVS